MALEVRGGAREGDIELPSEVFELQSLAIKLHRSLVHTANPNSKQWREETKNLIDEIAQLGDEYFGGQPTNNTIDLHEGKGYTSTKK
ncbi:MAG: hypothetical protein P4L74_06945 [Candidatus Doudnabacteria bacterium]|nr:hypothetical protein [Candidatus Doudnabacteria bacterium]